MTTLPILPVLRIRGDGDPGKNLIGSNLNLAYEYHTSCTPPAMKALPGVYFHFRHLFEFIIDYQRIAWAG